jgi:hypothetical protein
MNIDIARSRIRRFVSSIPLWWSQHQVVFEFFSRLDEAHYDTPVVDNPQRKSERPGKAWRTYYMCSWFT